MRRNIIILLMFGIWVATASIHSCSRDNFENPYDQIDYGDDNSEIEQASPFSITGLHRDIFKPRCSLPACHDGNFEPDYRSVQSTYSTLVYHPITKNNENLEFNFRVVPFDPEASVLIERLTNCCFVNQDDRMPQDNIGVPLEDELIDAIRQWIADGAKDVFDKVGSYPNTRARILFYVPTNENFDRDFSQQRLERFGSFILPPQQNIKLVVSVMDDSTAVADLINNRIRFSTERDDFSQALTIDSEYFNFNDEEFWITDFNSSEFPENTAIYFRVYSNDGEQESDTEFPQDDNLFVYKDFYSFIVQ